MVAMDFDEADIVILWWKGLLASRVPAPESRSPATSGPFRVPDYLTELRCASQEMQLCIRNDNGESE